MGIRSVIYVGHNYLLSLLQQSFNERNYMQSALMRVPMVSLVLHTKEINFARDLPMEANAVLSKHVAHTIQSTAVIYF